MESDKKEEQVTKRRSSRIRSLNVKVNDVLARSIECKDITKDEPMFLDNG